MTVLIDPPRWPAHGRLWSHLASDTSYDELHAFAAVAGVPRRAFEGDHYDVPQERYGALVAAGALAVETRDLLKALQRSGLRRQKRKGERVLASWPAGVDGARLDLLASGLPAPGGRVDAARVMLLAGPRLLLVPRDGGWDLPGVRLDDGTDPAGAAVHELAGVGVRVDAAALRPWGHERVSVDGSPTAWTTVVGARLPRAVRVEVGEWLERSDAEPLVRDRRWWPLLAWVLRD